ncbi:hypothetical protein TNCV_1744531 [Trichonephila clavipes]|nr:hypothetical protein TNCV_1744531 [Trichonephila clavipes]
MAFGGSLPQINLGVQETFVVFRIQAVEKLFYKYNDAASALKNRGRPSTLDNPARLTERQFIPHIPPTLVKREPTRHCKVGCLKKDANRKKDKERNTDSCIIIAELVCA